MKKIYFLLALVFAGSVSMAQFNIDAGATTYTQDFNSLTTGTWTNNVTLSGWYARTTATASITAYASNTGSTTTAGLYAYGTTTERSLGYATSNTFTGTAGSGKNFLGWRLKNNTGSTIQDLTITWDGEQWRRDNVATQSLIVSYQTGTTVTDLIAGTWATTSSIFTSPQVGAGLALDGNAVGNKVTDITFTLTGINLAAGDEIMIRWEDVNDANNDHHLTIDNVRVTATVQVTGTPDITLSSTDPAVAAGNIAQGSDNNVLYDFDLAVATANATFNGLTITTAGTYVAGDIENLKVWYSADNTFSPLTDVLLSTKITGLAPGTQTFSPFTSQVINSGTTGYIFVTADATCGATLGSTISVDAVTTGDISFVSGNETGTAFAGAAQTFVTGSPADVTGAGASTGNTTSTISWTTPTGCYDEVLIVASAGAPNSGTPTGDGTAYTGNLAFGSGTALGNGFVVYEGTSSPQTVTGLTNGTQYYFKIFTRSGSVWSSGVEVSATPAQVTTATDYFRSATSGLWSDASTWESSSDGATWIASTLVPTTDANVILIRNSHIVDVAQATSMDQVVIQNGGVLNNSAGIITVADDAGSPNDLTIQNGGVFNLAVSSGAPLGAGIIRTQTGGILRVSASGTIQNLQTARFVYETGSVLQYTLTTPPSASGVTYFPNVDAATIPILHLTSSIATAIGGGSATIVNGGLLVSGNVSFTGAGTKTFRNGIITNVPGASSVTQGTSGQFIINGTIAGLGGTINLGTAGMVISSGTVATLASDLVLNGGTLTIDGTLDAGIYEITGTGNIILNGTLITANADGISATGTLGNTGTNTIGSTSTVVYNGTGVQQFTAGTYANVSILGGGTKVLNGDVMVNGNLALTDGVVVSTASDLLTLGTAATFTGGSDLSYVDGPMARMTNAIATYTFPVGEDGDYRPFSLDVASADASTFTGDYNTPNTNTDAPNCTALRLQAFTDNEQWVVARTAGTAQAAVVLNYDETISDGNWINDGIAQPDPTSANLITVANYLPGTDCWEVYPDNLRFLAGDAASGQVATHAVDNFGIFTLGYGELAALPIKVNYIRGNKQGSANNITWSVTCINTPTAHMILERSSDARSFTAIHSLTATDQRCLQAFFYTDASPVAGTNYYRLVMTDADGKRSYSSTIAIGNKEKGFELVSMSPNPARYAATLSVSTAKAAQMTIRISNVAGKVMSVSTVNLSAGSNLIPVEVSALASGTYMLTGIVAGGDVQTIRFVKQ